MSDVVVRAVALGKRYPIGRGPARYRTIRESVTGALAAPFRRVAALVRGGVAVESDDHIWALDDVSFEIREGEVVGIIGSNGAGKSTLLKILSRITEPTRGYADIRGRVGSLLEVGTGFHYELTGRENIFLNGAILGMKRVEIAKKLDEIVAFAEIDTFLDTAVKHYSSGMYLRLAFAVAAHLEPEILLVDEVLAVGDVRFQKKCMGKMSDVAAAGRTVALVSHNLAAVRELCQTTMVIDRGRLVFRGPVVDGLAYYSQKIIGEAAAAEPATGTAWRHVRVEGEADGGSIVVASGRPMAVDAWLDLAAPFASAQIVLLLVDAVGNRVVGQQVEAAPLIAGPLEPGRYRVRVEIPALWLKPSVYTLYFKFFGRRCMGVHERHLSPHALIDVTGGVECVPGAALAPPIGWTIAIESRSALVGAAEV